LTFEGANPVKPVGVDPLLHVNNYFIDNDPAGWVIGARNYREVQYPGLYDGIDMRYHFGDGKLKYDFFVSPGADTKSIQIRFQGIQGLAVEEGTGDLLIRSRNGIIRDEAPTSYQYNGDDRLDVTSAFSLIDAMTASISVGPYDREVPMTIDPGLDFSTYIGGSGYEGHVRIAVNTHSSGDNRNVYFAVTTKSTTFPTTIGAYCTTHSGDEFDFIVGKLIDDGKNLSYSTYIGGSKQDAIYGIAVDASGNAIVTGRTLSPNFPVSSLAYQGTFGGICDGFAIKLNTTGQSLIYSTYLGGTDHDECSSIALDSMGNAFMTGWTVSNDFPVVQGCYDTSYNGVPSDSFVMGLNINGSKMLHSTYLGGSGRDTGESIFVDASGDVYVGGWTMSNDFPATQGAYSSNLDGTHDGYIVKMNSNLTDLSFATYLGGSAAEWIMGDVAIDRGGNITVSGITRSNDFPTTSGAYDRTYNGGMQDGFITKLNASGDKLIFSTYFGGTGSDETTGTVLDPSGDVYFSGETQSTDLPTTPTAYQDSYQGGTGDIFVGCLDQDGSKLRYSTYLGGSGYDTNTGAGSMHVGPYGVLIAGRIDSTNFPTTPGAYSRTSAGDFDISITRLQIVPWNATAPGEPRNLNATGGDRTVILEWDPPLSTGGTPIIEYRIHRGLSRDSMSPLEVTGTNMTGYVDTIMMGGQEYHYAVSAMNLVGEGNMSNVAIAIPWSPPAKPGDINATPGCGTVHLRWSTLNNTGGRPLLGYRLLRGESLIDLDTLVYEGGGTEYDDEATAGDAVVTLDWRAPLNDGGRALLGYKVYRGGSEDTLSLHRTIDGFTASFADEEVVNGQTYHYAILAFNEVGDGPLSSIVYEIPLGWPGIPRDLNLSASDGQVLIDWAVPETDGGTRILKYLVYRGVNGPALEEYRTVIETTLTDTDVDNGVTYTYQVSAVNEVGEGLRTSSMSATPLGLPEAPGDIVIEARAGQVMLIWLEPLKTGGVEVDNYTIYRGETEDYLRVIKVVGSSVSTYTDTDVVIGTRYFYRVTAVTAGGEGEASVMVSGTPFGPPGVPIDPVAQEGDGEVALFWDPPGDDGASPITGYVIMRGTRPASLREFTQLGDVSSYLDTTVTNDQTYYYVIAAINEAGPGEYTDTLEATPFRPATSPDKVLTLVAEAKGTKATLQWTPPTNDGGSPVTGYVILRGTSAGALEQAGEVGPSVTTYTDEGLKRGTTYYYSVVAKNAVGEGEPIAAKEVKVQKKEEGPGFEIVVLMASILIIAPIVNRRRG
jgi:fibronectin type 3 domain-containing protein